MGRKLSYTVREWEEVAFEADLTRIGLHPDWKMLEKGARKLGIAAYVYRNWLLKWMLVYNKKTEDMPIIIW